MSVIPLPRIARPNRLSEEVGAVLDQRIRSGEFAPGEKLPTEAQLSAQFSVSRAVVREAIARLKADGLVESRQGSGAFVAKRLGAASFRMAAGPVAEPQTAADVFELRLIVEAASAERAALRRTPEALAAIAEALARMEAALETGDAGAEADDAFHCAIAAASGNPLIRRFVEFVSQEFSDSRHPTWSREGRSHGLAQVAQDEHRAVFEAIAAGNPAAARAAAQQHLVNAAARLGIELPTVPPATDKNSEETL